jgi:hypothetical protein
MNNLKPNRVSPNRVIHWCLTAYQLMLRDLWLWLVAALTFFLLALACHRSVLLSLIVMLFSYYLNISLAASVDQTSWNKTTLRNMLQKRGSLALTLVLFQIIIPFVPVSLAFVVGGVPVTDLLYNEAMILDTWSTFLQTMYTVFLLPTVALIVALFCTGLPVFTSFFQFHLMALLGASWWLAQQQGDGGTRVGNLPTTTLLYVVMILVLLVVFILLPFLLPLAYSFISVLSYIAFREIYLGKRKNAPRLTRVEPVPANNSL